MIGVEVAGVIIQPHGGITVEIDEGCLCVWEIPPSPLLPKTRFRFRPPQVLIVSRVLGLGHILYQMHDMTERQEEIFQRKLARDRSGPEHRHRIMAFRIGDAETIAGNCKWAHRPAIRASSQIRTERRNAQGSQVNRIEKVMQRTEIRNDPVFVMSAVRHPYPRRLTGDLLLALDAQASFVIDIGTSEGPTGHFPVNRLYICPCWQGAEGRQQQNDHDSGELHFDDSFVQ